MANSEHLAKTLEGVKAWNKWRKENPGMVPELVDAELSAADLAITNLSEANLAGAERFGANPERSRRECPLHTRRRLIFTEN